MMVKKKMIQIMAIINDLKIKWQQSIFVLLIINIWCVTIQKDEGGLS